MQDKIINIDENMLATVLGRYVSELNRLLQLSVVSAVPPDAPGEAKATQLILSENPHLSPTDHTPASNQSRGAAKPLAE